ncbi:NAD(P)/FAD-dependent oxidoreductase [candidate division CSSED10-310 bacterium]|uniref:NAD(P)/FAD-dependent oxidoreductase n=1 Tax=candidate division CSSED10-310 bacterium TaxID=2855610 RepID=A0ABV6Z2X3_UNCC1
MRTSSPHIVIVGANFAGLAAATSFGPQDNVTVFDQSASFECLPNIHELVSGLKRSSDLQLSREKIIARSGHTFRQQKVAELLPEKHQVITDDGTPYIYDVCIVAVGGINNTYGIPGVNRWSLPFKSCADCAEIGRRLKNLAAGAQPFSIVIVGGGLEGIESLGEILRLCGRSQLMQVHLVNQAPRLISEAPEVIDRDIKSLCHAYPITFYNNTAVTQLKENKVSLSNGLELHTDLTIWTGGAAPSPFLYRSGLAAQSGQWASVKPTLQSQFNNTVFVAGDAAMVEPPLSKQGYHAIDMGSLVAQNCKRLLKGRAMQEFKPSGKPTLLSFGDVMTYLIAGQTVFASPALASMKEGVYHYIMALFDRPSHTSGIINLVQRSIRTTEKRILPSVTSLKTMLGFAHVRIL